MKWQLNTYLYLFHGYIPSWVFNFIVFFIHDSIVSYPNAEVDKKFFKSWDLHIPHWLRDLLWKMRAWSSETRFFFLPKSAESNQFLLEHIPWMNEFHDPGRPFKVAITTSAFFTSSSAGFLRSYFDLCSSLQIAWSRNQTSSMYLGKTLVEQVYLRLNHQ